MRLRRVRLATGTVSVAVRDDVRSRWVPLITALEQRPDDALTDAARDVVAFLAGGEATREAVARLLSAVGDEEFDHEDQSLLALEPRLMRNFSSWPQHWEQAARGLTKRYLPAGFRATSAFERVSGRTFPAFRAGALAQAEPSFYLGNHLTLIADGDEVPWPSYARDLDLELELAAVVAAPLHDVTAAQAERAIGGFVLHNDFTARDEQWKQSRRGVFGPTGKSKSFASALGAEVVTADEILPRIDSLTGTVVVNGETWSTTSTAGMQHGFGEMLAYSARGEQVVPGEVISSGTLPFGAGVEIDRWLQPGDVATIAIEGLGILSNPIGPRP